MNSGYNETAGVSLMCIWQLILWKPSLFFAAFLCDNREGNFWSNQFKQMDLWRERIL